MAVSRVLALRRKQLLEKQQQEQQQQEQQQQQRAPPTHQRGSVRRQGASVSAEADLNNNAQPTTENKELKLHSEDEVFKIGLKIAKVDPKKLARASKKTNLRRFKAEFGADPAVWAQIWTDLQTIAPLKIDVTTIGCNIENFLMVANFLKRYPTETEASNDFGPSENTIRKWRWYFVHRIRSLKEVKITWPREWTVGNIPAGLPEPLGTVDGVHFRRNEPTHGRWSKNPQYYSHKFKTAALNYEIAIHLFESRIVHVNGPFKASTPDITVFRKELCQKIPPGHYFIGDKGYLGESDVLMTPNSHDTPEVRDFKGRARARHEYFNKKLKRYECLDQRFTHGLEQQGYCFDAVLVVCQYEMEMGSPLWDV